MIATNHRIVLFLSLSLLLSPVLRAQEGQQKGNEDWKKIYRASATKYDDLVHTRLDVKFDYDKCYMYGKEWVTLKPHFYPTDTLSLDAKGMDIHQIAAVRGGHHEPLRYTYDGETLRIHLDRTYHRTEEYMLYIDYTSKPNELKVHKGECRHLRCQGLVFYQSARRRKR